MADALLLRPLPVAKASEIVTVSLLTWVGRGYRRTVDAFERVVAQAAAAGNCVIVGRGSQHFLRNSKET